MMLRRDEYDTWGDWFKFEVVWRIWGSPGDYVFPRWRKWVCACIGHRTEYEDSTQIHHMEPVEHMVCKRCGESWRL